jgi:hypothetical protein
MGYSGPIILIVDNLDKTKDGYIEKYGNEVYVFDKPGTAAKCDRGDNRPGLGMAMFARNACFDVAEDLGYTHFVQLDDDYTHYQYRFNEKMQYTTDKACRNLDKVFNALNNFLDDTTVDSVAIAQGGDFIGGSSNQFAEAPMIMRKCMNSWFCRTDRRIQFSMRMNDDVTTYILLGSRGRLFFTTNQVSLVQPVTQSVPGGMSEVYKESGTYLKTFYSIMASPSSVKVGILMGQSGEARLHHNVSWKHTVPKILRETWRKTA